MKNQEQVQWSVLPEKCKGTLYGSWNTFWYSSRILSIYCCCRELHLLVSRLVVPVFLECWGFIMINVNFWAWLISFFICLVDIITTVDVGCSSGVPYHWFHILTITFWGRDWYLSCRSHRQGLPNRASVTESSATSHSTSSSKGFIYVISP